LFDRFLHSNITTNYQYIEEFVTLCLWFQLETEDSIQEGFAITEFRVLPGASGPVALLSSSTPPLYGLPSIPPSVCGCNCSTTSAFTGNNLFVTPNDLFDS
jgi:hypothetical protein